MLTLIRRIVHSRVGLIVTFAVLIVIAIAFAAGDVTGLSSTSGGLTGSAVASIDGTSITSTELTKRAQEEVENIRQQQPTIDMAQYIAGGGVDASLDRMVNALALEKFGHAQGMIVGKRLIDGQLASIPALQGPTGKFDQSIYERLLSQRRLTDAAIREDIARETMSQHLILPTIGASQVPRLLALPYASLLLEKRAGQIGFIPTAAVGAGAAPTDAEVKDWYGRNIARYTVPERRVIRYAVVSAADVKVAPTDAEVAQAYQQSRSRYRPTEKRTVTQVTVLDQAAATALAARVRGGVSLGDAARAAGLEPRTVTAVEKPAYVSQSSAAVADAVFAAASGALVGPIRGSIGFVLARVDSIETVPGRTLDQARAEITATLTTQKSAEALAKVHDALDDAIVANANFNELVADQKLRAQTTPAIVAAGTNPDDPQSRADPAFAPIVAAGFAAAEGDSPTLVQTGTDGSFALVGVDRIVPSSPRPIGQIRALVARDFALARARRVARQVASTVTAKLNKGANFATALAETRLTLPPVQPLAAARAQLASNPRGAPPPLALMFSMAQGTAKLLEAPENGGWFVVKLNTITPGDAATQAGVVAATRADLGRAVGREYVQQFSDAVRRSVGVKRDANAVARVKAELAGQGGSNRP